MAAVFAMTAGGMLLLAGVDRHGTYVSDVLPGILVAGLGLGIAVVSVALSVLTGASDDEAGMLSRLNATGHEIGGSLGVAVLVTIATDAISAGRSASAARLASGLVTRSWRLASSPPSPVSSPFSCCPRPRASGAPRSANRRAPGPRCQPHIRAPTRLRRVGARTPNAASRACSTPPSTPSARIRRRAWPRSLAARAWFAPPSNVHLRTREALVEAVTERALAEAVAVINTAEPDRGDPVGAFGRVVSVTWRTLGRYHALVAIDTGTRTPEELHRRHGSVLGVLLPLIERGQASGAFRTDVTPEWHLAMLLALIHAASAELRRSSAGGPRRDRVGRDRSARSRRERMRVKPRSRRGIPIGASRGSRPASENGLTTPFRTTRAPPTVGTPRRSQVSTRGTLDPVHRDARRRALSLAVGVWFCRVDLDLDLAAVPPNRWQVREAGEQLSGQ